MNSVTSIYIHGSQPSAALQSTIERLAEAPVKILDNDADLPHETRRLIVGGSVEYKPDTDLPPPVLVKALQHQIPVLGTGWGMHALNVALGGRSVGRLEPGSELKTKVFITMGSKLAHILGGSGWLSLPTPHGAKITVQGLPEGVMASCHGDSMQVHAIEKAGPNWVIGLYWDIFNPDSLHKGFDRIVKVFVNYAK